MDLISVIIPVYNVEKYLIKCLDSVRMQTYQNLEIILVDDESPDNCPQMCDQWAEKDARIRVIHKTNGGLGLARNSGLDIATGKYITFVDSDDWISEDHIENLYNAIKEDNADIAIGSYTTVKANGAMIPRSLRIEPKLYENSAIIDNIVLPLIGPDLHNHQDVLLQSSSCMNLYRMNIIEANHLRFISERTAVSEDLYFNIDYLCNAEKVIALNEAGYYYFENMESISRKYDSKHFERTIGFYEYAKKQSVAYALDQKIGFRIERTFLLKTRVAIRLIVLSDLSTKEKYEEIKQILNHELVQKVLDIYPINTYIPAMRILTKLMKKRNVRGVYWLIKIRESAKNVELLKKMLKRIGIGR